MTALLRSAGWTVNRKRVERIWRKEGLKLLPKEPKRGMLWLNDGSCIRLSPKYPGHGWPMTSSRVVRMSTPSHTRRLASSELVSGELVADAVRCT